MSTDLSYRRAIRAWVLYDWANSAFMTTILAAMFPIFFRQLAVNAGQSESSATALWAYTNVLSLLFVAVCGPFLGTLADCVPAKKTYFKGFLIVGIAGTAMMPFLGKADYIMAAVWFSIANIGWFGANIFYEAMLPHIAKPEDMDSVSTKGYAFGYLGGGILLIINLLWTLHPEWFGIPNADIAVRLSFASVAVWWALFSIPFFKYVPEPPCGPRPARLWHESTRRLVATVRDVGRFRQLVIFLAAFWIYNDGISTVIKMATAYGDEIKIPFDSMIIALVITQFVGIPFAMLFGKLAGKIGSRNAIYLGLITYVVIAILGYFMKTAAHFYLLAGLVGLVQGGTQALSRSLFASMVPKTRATEFFGFFSTGSKVAGLFGPALFGIVAQAAGSSRPAILSVIVFFIIGGLLLTRVKIDQAQALARQIDEAEGKTGASPV
jgi:UMF1 family MFS transporter